MTRTRRGLLALAATILLFAATSDASVGDRLYTFRECVRTCVDDNCAPGLTPMVIPFHRRLLLWDCPSECDYLCQQSTTADRIAAGNPDAVVQYHGKWPFIRILGIQEPFSVLFSLANLWSHAWGLTQLRARIPRSYPLLPYYKVFSYLSIGSWLASAVFHTRDFPTTEALDYFGAGATVLYGLYYTPVRVFNMHRPGSRTKARLRAWTLLCAALYLAHVGYLWGVRWDYTYNMAANVAAGLSHYVLWYWFALKRYRETGEAWATLPAVCATMISMSMSLELFDFPPIGGHLDAHSLWHFGTIVPAALWYKFLVSDALDDLSSGKKKFTA